MIKYGAELARIISRAIMEMMKYVAKKIKMKFMEEKVLILFGAVLVTISCMVMKIMI